METSSPSFNGTYVHFSNFIFKQCLFINYVNDVMMCWYQAQQTISVTIIVTGSLTEVGVRWYMFSSTGVYAFILLIFFFLTLSMLFFCLYYGGMQTASLSIVKTEPWTYSRAILLYKLSSSLWAKKYTLPWRCTAVQS